MGLITTFQQPTLESPKAWGRWCTCLWSIACRDGIGPCDANSGSAGSGQTLSERQHEEGDRKACPMSLPATLPNGFLPPGVPMAPLPAIIERFGRATPRRQVLAERLEELLACGPSDRPTATGVSLGKLSHRCTVSTRSRCLFADAGRV